MLGRTRTPQQLRFALEQEVNKVAMVMELRSKGSHCAATGDREDMRNQPAVNRDPEDERGEPSIHRDMHYVVDEPPATRETWHGSSARPLTTPRVVPDSILADT